MTPNLHWTIGSVVLIDVSTRRYPRTVAMVDAIEATRILDGGPRWFAANYGGHTLYAARSGGRRNSVCRMHHVLCPVGHGDVTDHVNGDSLDNRRQNLRPATRRLNVCNRRKRKPGSSIYKGVYRHGQTGRWVATIMVRRRNLSLGCFDDERAAAAAYDQAARQHFGPFARPNFAESA